MFTGQEALSFSALVSRVPGSLCPWSPARLLCPVSACSCAGFSLFPVRWLSRVPGCLVSGFVRFLVSCVGFFPGLWAVAEFVGRTDADPRTELSVRYSQGRYLQLRTASSWCILSFCVFLHATVQLDIIEIVVSEFDVCLDLSMFLMMNLIERGYSFTANAEKEIVMLCVMPSLIGLTVIFQCIP